MKKILTCYLFSTSLFLSAQNEVSLSDNQLNANLAPLSISYEKKIDDFKTISIAAGLGYELYFEASREFGVEGSFGAAPIIYGSLREYYSRRKIKKNNLRNNSGNYVGLFVLHQFEVLLDFNSIYPREIKNKSNFTSVGPVWGIQRNYASGIHVDFSIGPGLKVGRNISESFTLVGRFELGFLLISK